jgi:hypothetical protein
MQRLIVPPPDRQYTTRHVRHRSSTTTERRLTHAPRPKAAVIVAAGRGVRAGGGLPKQYRMLRGKPVLAHTVAAFDRHPDVGEIVIVRNADAGPLSTPAGSKPPCPLRVVTGGAERDASVRAGLDARFGGLSAGPDPRRRAAAGVGR